MLGVGRRVVGVVVKDDLTQLSRKTGERGKKAHLTDMLRDVWTRTGLAQNHTAVLGAVEVKAVLQLRAYQSLVRVFYWSPEESDLKDRNQRMTLTDRKRRADMGTGNRLGRGVNTMVGKSQDVQNTHMPYRCLEWFLSPFRLNNQCHAADSLHIPTDIRLSQPSFLLQERRVLSYNLWTKLLLKEGCTESSVDLQVMQLSQNRIIHRAILWTDRMRMRCWTITISVLYMFGLLCPQLQQFRRGGQSPREESKPANTTLQT